MDFQKELIAEFDTEVERCRKLLNAIPEDADFTWKPHEKSMTLGKLGEHVADLSGDWPLMTLTQDGIQWNPSMKKPQPASKAELLDKFEKESAEAKSALAAFDPANWTRQWTFRAGEQVFIDKPKYKVWREVVVNHGTHHRGQLTVYLRLLGAKVPGTYGPSADEM